MGNFNGHRLRDAIAFRGQPHALSDSGKPDLVAELCRAADWIVIRHDHDIALSQACPIDGRARNHLCDLCPLRASTGSSWIQVLETHPDAAALDATGLDNLFHDAARHVDGDRKADADVSPAWGYDRRVDADKLTPEIDETAARIARIDGSVGLNKIFMQPRTLIVVALGKSSLDHLFALAPKMGPQDMCEPVCIPSLQCVQNSLMFLNSQRPMLC